MRPSLPEDEKKCKISITLDKDVMKYLDKQSNKSKFINNLLKCYFKKEKES